MAYIGGGIEPGRGIGKREKQETWRNAKYIRPDAFKPGPPEGIDKMTKETSHYSPQCMRETTVNVAFERGLTKKTHRRKSSLKKREGRG